MALLKMPSLPADNASLNKMVIMVMIAAFLLLPSVSFADPDVTETSKKVCGFFENINSLLNAASIVVVTIAVIFSGYQIAFAHKRIADVAPALVGGVLIGAAAQVAKMVVGGNGGASECKSSSGAFLIDAMQSALHLLQIHA
ncbi:type IV secretion system protein VirB2 [Luteibacter sp. UNCMF331Sha3.1]|uniref:TrbC/VirB2 family protein n=1 Tax=Luteibacter sp. UNCMF331Sha3.1 TaxID=1502760 RepID=UPI0008AA9C5D|nr:TrbC/VirB2 family protein [Luteibacter sp. UNCMF331Sha3.1]SEM95945.1 type IV secretion system protein VirB2 [Luteibacter sp. UNCMF331Sha3.1]